jgi:hypothetical protein
LNANCARGNIKKPRQILPGGYISFIDPQKDEVEQILFLGPTPQQDLASSDHRGVLEATASRRGKTY